MQRRREGDFYGREEQREDRLREMLTLAQVAEYLNASPFMMLKPVDSGGLLLLLPVGHFCISMQF